MESIRTPSAACQAMWKANIVSRRGQSLARAEHELTCTCVQEWWIVIGMVRTAMYRQNRHLYSICCSGRSSSSDVRHEKRGNRLIGVIQRVLLMMF